MSDRYPGGIIVANPTAPTTTVASGIWTLEQQAYYKAQGTWPSPPYLATNSLRFRKSASAYLTRTPASASNRKTWTWSAWVKRGALDASYQALLEVWNGNNNNQCFNITWGSDDTIYIAAYSVAWRVSTAVYRDPSSWYHLVVAVDTTQATGSDRIKVYVNGTQVTSFGTSNDPTQNDDLAINQNAAHYFGSGNARNYSDGYLAEVNFVDGQQLTPSSFGITSGATGVWQPKLYTGSYGTNGYYLPFSDIALTSGSNAGLGKDFSGNGNYWNTNNISITSGITYDAMTDVPTLTSATVANYPTLNPLDIETTSELPTGGNLNANGGNNMRATIACPSSGKWYFEYTRTNTTTSAHVGIFASSSPINTLSSGSMLYRDDGYVYENNVLVLTSWASYTTNDVIGVAVDVDSSQVSFYKNNTLQGTRTFVSQITASSAMFAIRNNTNATASVNFGQRPFTYTPPSGYLALNTYNLPTPTVLQGDDYFAATLYTGTGSSQSITNTGFQPDLVWTKSRSNAYNNTLVDAVRGVSRSLVSDLSDAEDYSAGSYVTAFNLNGFSVGTGTGSNGNGATYVAWQWKGNGSGSSNTDGTITSTVSANATSKCSIVTYTGNGSAGATIGHGLGATPAIIIVKRRDAAASWPVLLKAATGDEIAYLDLSNTSTPSGNATIFGNNSAYVAPTSTVFTVGTNTTVNASGGTYVAYLFAAVDGFSAFGKYTGNGSSNGPFIYTGFRPAYTIIKGVSNIGEWTIHDNQRPTYNQSAQYLFADVSDAEYNNVYNNIDYLSNGFKCRGTTGTNQNGNGYEYAYMAFAENPFKYALAR